MDDLERRRAALEMMAIDLERLIRQASANDQPMLAYLLELALVEAQEALQKTVGGTAATRKHSKRGPKPARTSRVRRRVGRG